MKDDHQILIDWLDLYSVSIGEEFTLASGQKSNVYVDVKKTALNGRVTPLLAKLLFEVMIKEFMPPTEVVAGVELGGCHLASIVAMYSAIHTPRGFDTLYVRKEAKNHGTKRFLEKTLIPEWAHVVLLEDVVTTGESAIKAAQRIDDAGFTVTGIISVVDRRPRKSDLLRKWPFRSLVNFEELHP